MAKYKLKLKEAPAPNLAKQGNYKIGDITYSKDGDTRFAVDDINRHPSLSMNNSQF